MKLLSLLISVLFITSCASNLPYVDTFDVQEIESGMSMSEIEGLLGKPMKVKGSESEMIWEYKFRTLENPNVSWMDPVKGNKPVVVGGESALYCIFTNGTLTKWGSCLEDC
tara:strand:- start:441 stop:773 length:333 start_codon:yes stop_codon:yes gene_type:complete